MKRITTALASLALALLLAGCSGDLVKSVYTAAGDGTSPDSVNKTTVFHPNDDLNVVVELNTHRRTLELTANFIAPNGAQYGTNTLEADETTPWALLGLDWEASGGADWPPGEWTVNVFIDGHQEATLKFDVLVSETPPAQ